MWKGKKVTIIFPTYKERGSIRKVIEDFDKTRAIDEILVVHHEAEPGTEDEVRKVKTHVKPKIIHGPKQHLGYSLKEGMKYATGHYVIWAEPDGTFSCKDIFRLLIYAEDFAVVFGSRTNQSTILGGSAMSFSRRLSNFIVAKIMEVLFNTQTMTDVGCVFRVLRHDVIKKLSYDWHTNDATFPTEVQVSIVAHKIPFVEIPITFKARVGESTLVPDFKNTLKWGIKLTWFILKYRLFHKTRKVKLIH